MNEILKVESTIDLTICADVSSDSSLNQYSSSECDVKVIDSKMYVYKGLVFRKNISSIISNGDYDLICFYANPREISLSLLMLKLWLYNKKFITYGMFHKIGKLKLYTKLYYKYIGVVSLKCLTYSRKGASVLLTLGVAREKVTAVGTAINEKKIFQEIDLLTSEDLHRFREEQKLIGRTVILQVVRLSKIKKPELLIEAANIICRKNKMVDFYLIGDGEMFSDISELIETKGLTNRVKMLGSIYDEGVLAKWYLSSRVFVMPTCIGLSAHHAMAYGLPIVTDDDFEDQASEFDILYNGLNCLTYIPGDVQSMCDSIVKIVENDELYAFLSDNATATVRDVHNIRNKAISFVEKLTELKLT